MGSFGDRLVDAVHRTGPLCAGIDPSAALLVAWGLPDDAEGLRAFGWRCLEAFAGVVPVVKPQVAFFERHGSAGFAALEELLAGARDAGMLTIADAKRGDIGSTSEAYAQAWLDGSSSLAADAVTTTPYLGLGALRPLVDAAQTSGRGVFVVVRSSNPEGRPLQEATVAGGGSVEDGLLAAIAELNSAELDRSQGVAVGSIGAVIGATLRPSRTPLPQVGGVFLAPGVGAQGATPADVAALFAGCPRGTVLPNASRSILAAGPSVASLRAAAIQARDELAAVLL
jgi:orotidine-5'-phosphate decarboxylase